MNPLRRFERLKERIRNEGYDVDVDAVADAIVDRLLVKAPESGAGSPRGASQRHPE